MTSSPFVRRTRAILRNAEFGYEPLWSPDGTLILFKRTVVLPDLPTFYVVGLDGQPPRPLRPDVLGRFGSAHAAWHPDGRRISIWGTIRDGDVTFLTVPLEAGSGTAAQIPPRIRQDLAWFGTITSRHKLYSALLTSCPWQERLLRPYLPQQWPSEPLRRT